jgi:hypothetical protein
MTIGQTGEGIGFVNDRLQNVQISDTALSASEVAALVPEPCTLAGCAVALGSLVLYRFRRWGKRIVRATTGDRTRETGARDSQAGHQIGDRC